MCQPPTPDEFHEMDQEGKFLTLFDLLCKMASNINFVRRWGWLAAVAFFGTGLVTMAGRGKARDERITALDTETTRIKHELAITVVKDSLNNLQVHEKLDAIMQDLDIEHPRGNRR